MYRFGYMRLVGNRARRWLGAISVLALLFGAGIAEAGQTLLATVVRVVDGDTIEVRLPQGRTEKVRYIGMDTPEIHHPQRGEEPGGRRAAAVNRRLTDGQSVRLELDVQERDRYRRLLAYVYVGDVMINAELVRLGYAQVMTIPPNVRHAELFRKLEREARENARGLWAAGR
jgi:micrococcal nuclease